MEKETIEEAAKEYAKQYALSTRHISHIGFEDGAKYMAERMYSEDDVDELVNNLIDKFLNYNGSSVDNEKLKWFYQQIKKK